MHIGRTPLALSLVALVASSAVAVGPLTVDQALQRIRAAGPSGPRLARRLLPSIGSLSLADLRRLSAAGDPAGVPLQTGAVLHRGLERLDHDVSIDDALEILRRFDRKYGYRDAVAEALLPRVEALSPDGLLRLAEATEDPGRALRRGLPSLRGELAFAEALAFLRQVSSRRHDDPARLAFDMLPKIAGLEQQQMKTLIDLCGGAGQKPWLAMEAAHYLVGGIAPGVAAKLIAEMDPESRDRFDMAATLLGDLTDRSPEGLAPINQLLPEDARDWMHARSAQLPQ